MTTLLNARGLTAIFKDAAMIPYNATRLYWKVGGIIAQMTGSGPAARAFGIASGALFVANGHALPALVGLSVGSAAGPAAGVAAYYALSHWMAACISMGNKPLARETFWPAVTAALKQPQPQPAPPAP